MMTECSFLFCFVLFVCLKYSFLPQIVLHKKENTISVFLLVINKFKSVSLVNSV